MGKGKVILIVAAVIILLAVFLMNVKYNQKWKSCGSDDDCVLVNDVGFCACGDTVINKNSKFKYGVYSLKQRIGGLYDKFLRVKMCEPCAQLFDPVAKCMNDYCQVMPSCRDESAFCMISDVPCCEGLVEVPSMGVTADGICTSPTPCGGVCRPCGNGVCDSNENKCNCPEDCS